MNKPRGNSVPQINGRHAQSKLSLWTWRAGLIGGTLVAAGSFLTLLAMGAAEVIDVMLARR